MAQRRILGPPCKVRFVAPKLDLTKDCKTISEVCEEDWLEIYEIYPNGRESIVGRYCSKSTPGPIVSDKGVHTMKVVLRTDAEGVASGFLATYIFIDPSKKFEECGFNISGQTSGVLTSPGFPAKYKDRRQVCHWYIHVKQNAKILLLFTFFRLEGDPLERGCPGAVVRVWKNLSQAPIEMCGMEPSNDTLEIISANSVLKLTLWHGFHLSFREEKKTNRRDLKKSRNSEFTFATAEKAIGAEGFKAVWTEVSKTTGGLLATDHEILNHGQVTWTTPELAPPSPNYHTTGRTFQLSTDLTCFAALHGGSLVVLGSNSRPGKPRSDTYTTRLPRPPVISRTYVIGGSE
ncbi:cubilin [Trichonephila clavipes]|nr:cubilin [Trichonephila clavipes]